MEVYYIRTNWSTTELNTLSTNLTDGLPLQVLENLLTARTPKAISKKALAYNYSSKTVDGITVMKLGINRRVRRGKSNQRIVDETASTETTTAIVTSEPRNTANISTPETTSECLDNKSDVIVAEIASKPINGLEANQLAITMLRAEKLPIEPTIVCILSEYILVHKDQICVN